MVDFNRGVGLAQVALLGVVAFGLVLPWSSSGPVTTPSSNGLQLMGESPTGGPPNGTSTAANSTPCSSGCPGFLGPVTSSGSSPLTYTGHYWIGAYYSGTSFTSSSIYTTITTPSSGPHANETYYELLSTWDDNGNYDQIGIASVYYPYGGGGGGTTNGPYWQFLWSIMNYKNCNAFTWNSAAGGLGQWSNYTFEMTLTGSKLVYDVYAGVGTGGSLLYTTSQPDTATNFRITSTVSYCGGTYDTTDYEEVYYIANSMQFPQWDFQFDDTYAGSTLITSWGNLNSGQPSNAWGYWEAYPNSRGSVQIANEPFEILFPGDVVFLNPRGTSYNNGSVVSVGHYCSWGFGPCTLTMSCSVPAGWGGSYAWGTYVPTTVSFDYGPPSNAPAGHYFPGCSETITAGPNAFSTFIFYTFVS